MALVEVKGVADRDGFVKADRVAAVDGSRKCCNQPCKYQIAKAAAVLMIVGAEKIQGKRQCVEVSIVGMCADLQSDQAAEGLFEVSQYGCMLWSNCQCLLKRRTLGMIVSYFSSRMHKVHPRVLDTDR